MAFLYITEQGAMLKKSGQRLMVEKDGAMLLDIPASKIEGVLIFGNVQFTTQAVQLLFQHGIEMALFTSHGKLLGQLTSPLTKNITLRQAQYARYSDADFILSLARSIVRAKMANSLEFVREFSHNHPDTDLAEETSDLAHHCSRIDSQGDLSALLGLEGAGARAYFHAFAKMVRHSFVFTGRRRHPLPDPVNALLSLGYTLMYNEISSLLDGLGFDPFLGFYHQPHYGHATLASDLMEEFRTPLIDRFTLNMINNRIFQEEDFYYHTASRSIYLKEEPRKRYFLEYEGFITRPMISHESSSDIDFRKLFRQQAERLKHTIVTGEAYCPYTFHW